MVYSLTTPIRDWQLPIALGTIGYAGDVGASRLVFTGADASMQYKLDLLHTQTGMKNVLDMVNDGGTLSAALDGSVSIPAGRYDVQLRTVGDVVAHTNKAMLTVEDSIDAVDSFEPANPTEMAQLEARLTALKVAAETAGTDAESAAGDAADAKAAAEAAQGKAEDAQNAAEAAQAGAEAARDTSDAKAGAAKTSAAGAEISKNAAAQAFSDLLNIIGTQVATLDANGHLTASQIPPIAVNDTYPVADTAAMLALTAQRGDVALIVADNVVTDSYILAAGSPAVLDNWKKLGVSYVTEAGHALHADAASDANRINGHRMVEMTGTAFETAVKDSGTYYLVYDEAVSE